MDITIRKNENGSLFAYADNDFYPLFQFEYRSPNYGNGWHFWLKGERNPNIFEGTDFPISFFLDACKAVAFIWHSTPLSENVQIVEGKNLIVAKAKKSQSK